VFYLNRFIFYLGRKNSFLTRPILVELNLLNLHLNQYNLKKKLKIEGEEINIRTEDGMEWFSLNELAKKFSQGDSSIKSGTTSPIKIILIFLKPMNQFTTKILTRPVWV